MSTFFSNYAMGSGSSAGNQMLRKSNGPTIGGLKSLERHKSQRIGTPIKRPSELDNSDDINDTVFGSSNKKHVQAQLNFKEITSSDGFDDDHSRNTLGADPANLVAPAKVQYARKKTRKTHQSKSGGLNLGKKGSRPASKQSYSPKKSKRKVDSDDSFSDNKKSSGSSKKNKVEVDGDLDSDMNLRFDENQLWERHMKLTPNHDLSSEGTVSHILDMGSRKANLDLDISLQSSPGVHDDDFEEDRLSKKAKLLLTSAASNDSFSAKLLSTVIPEPFDLKSSSQTFKNIDLSPPRSQSSEPEKKVNISQILTGGGSSQGSQGHSKKKHTKSDFEEEEIHTLKKGTSVASKATKLTKKLNSEDTSFLSKIKGTTVWDPNALDSPSTLDDIGLDLDMSLGSTNDFEVLDEEQNNEKQRRRLKEKYRDEFIPEPLSSDQLTSRVEKLLKCIPGILKGHDKSPYYKLAYETCRNSKSSLLSYTEFNKIPKSDITIGYYGMKRQTFIASLIKKRYRKEINDVSLTNKTIQFWTIDSYVLYVLACEIGWRLAAEDFDCGQEEAIRRLKSTLDYGKYITDNVPIY